MAPRTIHPSPVCLWPRPGVHFAQIDDDLVALDVLADAYHVLAEIGGSARLTETGGLEADGALRPQLIATGLVVETPPALPPRRAPPVCGALRPPLRRPRLSDAPAAVVLARAGRWYERHALVDLVRPLTPRLTPAVEAPSTRLTELLEAARAIRPWVPGDGACLKRAFQLRAWLAVQGVAPDWVFGVRTWPFAAHCWLQAGDRVLDDTVERIGRYVPIMVV